jgi:TetR/AcrR family transcriptional repressor of nem operon
MAIRNDSPRASRRGTQLTARSARKRESHERILKTARRIARREGLRAASVPRVMSGAGLTVGGFYAHFESKTALDVEIVRTMLGGLPKGSRGDTEDLAGLEWVRQSLDEYLSVTHRDNPDGCPYPAVLSELAAAVPEVRREFAASFQTRVRALEAHMAPALGASVRERSLATMALKIGGLLLARASRGDSISEEILNACKRWALPEYGPGH